MPTNAILTMFLNLIKDLEVALNSTTNSLKAGIDAPNEILKNQFFEEGITSVEKAAMVLSALKDFAPLLKGLTTATNNSKEENPAPPPVEKPRPSYFHKPDESDVYG